MNCNVIQDLMILYTDSCCSNESKVIVEEHIKTCFRCKKAFEEMNDPEFTVAKDVISAPKKFKRINNWKASIIQSALLFISFILLTVGVALEASTPFGNSNGIWAVSVIVPTTGFLLSLANWYFVRLYPSKKVFSNCSLFATIVLIVCGYIWGIFHYGVTIFDTFTASSFSIILLIIGIVLLIAFCLLSKILSKKYADMLGKE